MLIQSALDVEMACRRASSLGVQCGLTPRAQAELKIIVSELATNLIRHAGGGVLILDSESGERGHAVIISTHDNGPGIAEIGRAFEDGYSADGGLGGGLGAIQRLATQVDVWSSDSGTTFAVRKAPS